MNARRDGRPAEVVFVPMSAAVYANYVEAAVAGYADDNVASGRWPADGALARSRADFDAYLPQGLETPDNYLFEIRGAGKGLTVGSIWFAVREEHGLRTAFVHDVEVKPESRRQGYATAAFRALEPLVRDLGLTSIGLHVFGHNTGAQALYGKLGYEVTGVNMQKRLEGGSR
jgi:RimJ/RimL family protein N-acetyltransferase